MDIKDLFYNLPARLKFLKSSNTEFSYIQELVQAIALAHPECSIELKKNGKTALKTSGQNNLLQTVKEVYSSDIISCLKEVLKTDQLSGLKISGYVSTPDYTRSSKKGYHIYINGRNPNREKVTSRAADGSLETVARRTIRMNSLGPGGIVAEDTYLHSLVNGRGTGGVVLVTDSVGKLLAPYLSEIYQWVYVVNVEKDREFRQDLPGILEEIGADTVIYAASETRMGNRSYMRALNPFIRGEE